MKTKYERQLKKGVLEILVLQLLSLEKMYGYQLIMKMKEVSHEMFSLREGTLYPILYRLEDDELIESEWSQPQGRENSRKYYSITEKGLTVLDELKGLWSSFSQMVTQILGDEKDG